MALPPAFLDEVRGSLDYFAASNPEHPVERVVVSGGGSCLRGLAERLSSTTRYDVVAGDEDVGVHLRVGVPEVRALHR